MLETFAVFPSSPVSFSVLISIVRTFASGTYRFRVISTTSTAREMFFPRAFTLTSLELWNCATSASTYCIVSFFPMKTVFSEGIRSPATEERSYAAMA